MSLKKALVVDDNEINRYLLNAFLSSNDYEVIEAKNGLEAVEKFSLHQPGIIFMDLMMPIMDGIEACKKIKALCGQSSFVSILFVTAVSDEDKLTECIEAGGDDFITKPIDLRILDARIKSLERLNDLYIEHFAMVARVQRDQEIAKNVFNSVVLADSLESNEIKTLLKPAEIFSGDMLLSARSLSGDVHIMLADFTGHGLGAAIGAIPASDVFKAMTSKGFSGEKTLTAVNSKLKRILPTGMFMAVQYAIIRKELDYASICVCGMPDVLIRNSKTQKITQRISSKTFPLGVSANVDFSQIFEKIPITNNDSIILFTDGVTEATDPNGKLFGQDRLENLLEASNGNNSIKNVELAIKQFCDNGEQTDDISLAEIICSDKLFIPEVVESSLNHDQIMPEMELISMTHQEDSDNENTIETTWEYILTLKGQELVKINPIPILIGQLHELNNQLDEHAHPLYTILTELYVNALDHGILNLDSSLKHSPKGFESYFNERENRLKNLKHDKISFIFKGFYQKGSLKIKITIIDSGNGFNTEKILEKITPKKLALSGRGIYLVHELCESIVYNQQGNKVEVVYVWNHNK